MKYLLIFFIFLFLQNCSKPKTVLICGNHICVNKAEAEQYFEENLTIEVKIIDKTKNKKINLIELNLESSLSQERMVSIEQKSKTKKQIKTLSNNQIEKIKKKIKEKKKNKKIVKRIIENNSKEEKKLINKNSTVTERNKLNSFKNPNKKRKKVVDICTIIKKCSIGEISKYLIKQGKNNKFPDITIRE